MLDSTAGVNLVDELIAELSGVCAGLPDKRKGPGGDDDYTMAAHRPVGILDLLHGQPVVPGPSAGADRGARPIKLRNTLRHVRDPER